MTREQYMKILFLGDSITEGYMASSPSKNFVTLTAKKLGAEFKNYGVGGTRIARQEFAFPGNALLNYDFNMRFEVMDKKADLVIVMGGTNDFGQGAAPLGKENDTTPFTFNGAVNYLFDNLSKTYGNKNIIVILPLPRYNQDSIDGDGKIYKQGVVGTLADYTEIIKKAANKYDLYVADYTKEFGVPPIEESKYFADGLHPNDNGYELLSNLLVNDIKALLSLK